jgi:hypothetical protein
VHNVNSKFEQHDGKIVVKLDGKPFTAYHYSDKWDKPFLQPILAASGEVVTRGWPVEPLPGDGNDHVGIGASGTRTATSTALISGARKGEIRRAA